MSPLNRRDVFKISGAGLLAAMMTQGVDWAAMPSALAATPHPLAGAAVDADPVPVVSGQAFLPPYSATATTILSEDYFLTNQVIMGPGDRVLPFQLQNGSVEALVFNAGQGSINYLQADPTSSSGWTYNQVPINQITNGQPLTDCAVQLGSDGTVYCAFTNYIAVEGILNVYWMTLAPGAGNSWSILQGIGTETWRSAPGPLKSNVDPNGQAFIYSINNNGTANVWQAQANEGAPSIPITGLPPGPFNDAAMVWNFNWNSDVGTSKSGVIVVAPQGQGASTLVQNGPTSVVGANVAPTFALIPWIGWPTGGSTNPDFVAQDTSGNFWYTYSAIPYQVGTCRGQAGQGATWFAGGLLTTALLVDDTATIVTQYSAGPPGDFAFTDGIPIAGNLMAVTGSAINPTNPTIFAVDAASTLQVLVRDPITQIWTTTAVSQNVATTQSITTWRTEIELTDSNGLLLAGCPVTITPSQTTGFWEVAGSTIASPNTPLSTTADTHGRVTLAIVASEIDAPMLSVQVYNGSTPSGPSVTVNPAQNVHDFFAGTGSIDGVGTLTSTDGSSLLNAQTSTGAPLFPVLNQITDPTQQAKAATAVAGAINQCMAAANPGIAPAPGATFVMDFASGTPTYTPPTPPSPSGQIRSPESIGSWFSHVLHDIESVFHGIRHGLIAIEKFTATFISDAEGWAVSLAITIGTEISDIVHYAITDIRSAIHAVSGFFNSLGADILAVIEWLRTNIIETFESAAANAKTMVGWLSNLGNQMNNDLAFVGNIAENFFSDTLAHDISSFLGTTVGPVVGSWTLGDYSSTASGSATPSGSVGAAATPAVGGVENVLLDVVKVWRDVQGNWLFHKLESEFESLLQTPGSSDTITAAVNKLIGTVTGQDWLENIGESFWTAFKQNSTSDVDGTKGIGYEAILTIVTGLVDTVITFADQVIADLLALAQAVVDAWVGILQTNLLSLPLISELLNWFGIDLQLDAGSTFGLVLMFPTTIIYRIKFGGNGTMFAAAPPEPTNLDKFTVPFLVTHGSGDRQIPLEYAYAQYEAAVNSPKRELHIFSAREGGVEHVGGDNMLPAASLISDWVAENL